MGYMKYWRLAFLKVWKTYNTKRKWEAKDILKMYPISPLLYIIWEQYFTLFFAWSCDMTISVPEIANIRGNACRFKLLHVCCSFSPKKRNDNKGHFNKSVNPNSIKCCAFFFHGFYFKNCNCFDARKVVGNTSIPIYWFLPAIARQIWINN